MGQCLTSILTWVTPAFVEVDLALTAQITHQAAAPETSDHVSAGPSVEARSGVTLVDFSVAQGTSETCRANAGVGVDAVHTGGAICADHPNAVVNVVFTTRP